MGIFGKKEYTLSEALRIVNEDNKKGYDFIPIDPNDVNTKYRIEEPEKTQEKINELKPQIKTYTKQRNFRNRINGNGYYQNRRGITTSMSKYNDYQTNREREKSSEQIYR